MEKFEEELRQAINRNSIDNYLNIPDYILANYLKQCVLNLKEIQELEEARNSTTP